MIGEVLEVIDDAGGKTRFGYEPFGGLAKTIDPNLNEIKVSYDLWGRKTDLADPDLGLVHYDVDPLGRTWAQTSPVQRAAGTRTTMQFDWLDRMLSRSEPATSSYAGLNSYWVFDTATYGVGKLAEAYTLTGTTKDYDRIHTYDSAGRPLETVQQLYDGAYKQSVIYDTWGRVITNVYQRGTDPVKQFDTRYNGNGYLARLERGTQILWQVNQQDAAQHPLQVLMGNGLSQTRRYYDYTNRLKDALVSTSASQRRLQETYTYDPLGNVLTRNQYWGEGGFAETFKYDNLNRLTYSVTGSQAPYYFGYDAAGNLKTKGTVDTPTHTYPQQGPTAVRPHAVQTVSGVSGNFIYDGNGNLVDGGGRTIAWTIFDMPSRITKGSVYASFEYGPEHQRTRQNRSDGTVVVYAGPQEVETKNGQVLVKTYWPYGIGVEIDRPGASAPEMSWTHVDRLGSPVALSNQNGDLREKLAYDPWGKRRTTDGSNATPDTLDGVTDNRGFTGHEMLDQLDLVHMNGRVYDPLAGRFLSGDPIIQEPINGQSYNRYSYVLNNPTNLTDPTGFASMCEGAGGKGISVCGFMQCFGDCLGKFLSELGGEFSKGYRKLSEPNQNEVKKTYTDRLDAKNRSDTNGKDTEKDSRSIRIFHYDGDWKSSDVVTSEKRFINGMNNTEQQAKDISLVEMTKMKISEFDLVHIPSLGFTNDLIRANKDKLGLTTETADQLSAIIRSAGPGEWYAHSYGGVAFAEAVRTLGRSNVPAGQSITFLGAANNQMVTNRIMTRAGVHVSGYYGSWFDPVPNIAGLNSRDPLQWTINILALPFLATPWSPHTHPPVK